MVTSILRPVTPTAGWSRGTVVWSNWREMIVWMCWNRQWRVWIACFQNFLMETVTGTTGLGLGRQWEERPLVDEPERVPSYTLITRIPWRICSCRTSVEHPCIHEETREGMDREAKSTDTTTAQTINEHPDERMNESTNYAIGSSMRGNRVFALRAAWVY